MRGYVDIYQGARDKALAAMNGGKRFVMQPEGTGTDSNSDPTVYIGTPSWQGPTRDLWAEFSQIELRIGPSGPWFKVIPGGVYAPANSGGDSSGNNSKTDRTPGRVLKKNALGFLFSFL